MLELLKKSIINWYNRDPFTRSAAISYYTIFSFPALLIILMSIANFFIDAHIVESNVVSYMATILGEDGAEQAFKIVDRVNLQENDRLILMFGVFMLFLTSLRLFMQLQKALNEIWETKSEGFSIRQLIVRRALSFAVIISIGFVLLVSLLLTSMLTALGDWLAQHISVHIYAAFHVINLLFSWCVISSLFAVIIKMLPDRRIRMTDALRGGAISAGLFMLGQYLLNIYFSIAEPESAYGVSGSIILLMIWVSYSALILLFGAEFSKAYVDRRELQKAS